MGGGGGGVRGAGAEVRGCKGGANAEVNGGPGER